MPTKNTDTKQRIAYISAIVAFTIGWGLTIAGFILPPRGEVDGSVLAVLGEAMIYTASVLGITLYFGHQMHTFKQEVNRSLKHEQEYAE